MSALPEGAAKAGQRGSRCSGGRAGAAGLRAAAAELARAFHQGGSQPGLAYGIIADGVLVHGGGFGLRRLGEAGPGGAVPDADTVFRIASMTKSFTAAAVLALRDDGMLALDDPASEYVPELHGLRLPTPDSPPLSLRHLLTMTAGFPTDDPWGDRQQGLPPADFARLLDGGIRFAWTPGTRFEYSNLGYAILGRVICAASGSTYPEFVRDRLLRPLGMSATGFTAEEFPAERLAAGYRRTGDGWSEVVPDPCGAFAPMGGLFSCVRDLARWVGGFAGAFPPGAERAEDSHPLARASRREMQLPQAGLAPPPAARLPGAPGGTSWLSYGAGLLIEEHPIWGRIVGHSGGYPGFGSQMRWHPATGLGAVVLANGTYAGVGKLATRLLTAALRQPPGGARAAARQPPGRQPALAPTGPWPETLAAREQVNALLRLWDDEAADRLFAPSVALDRPYPERRRQIALVRERIGEFGDHPQRPAEFASPAQCRWWLRGERGVVRAEIQLSPEARPRVQSLTLAVPPAAGSPLAAALAAIVALLNETAPAWPPAMPACPGLDTGLALRQLRMAAAWAGRCAAGACCAGDGEGHVTIELDGQHARLILAIAVDPEITELRHLDLTLAP